MSMFLNIVAYYRGPKHLLLAAFVQWRRVSAADLAGLELSACPGAGLDPTGPLFIQAVAGTLEALWPEVSLLAEMSRHNQPKIA